MTVGVAMRPGVRVGVDVGTVRVGVAASDASATLASPVTVVARRRRDGADIAEVAGLVAERAAVEVLVGLPRSLRGRTTASADDATAYARALAAAVAPVAVRLVDERLSTVAAQRGLHAAGRDTKASRGRIDAAAAAVVLQAALDQERATGQPPGTLVTP